MPIIAMLIGATLGFWLGHDFDALAGGGFVGLIVGLIIHQYRRRAPSHVVDPVASRFAGIEARLARLEATLERAGLAPVQSTEPQTSESVAAPVPETRAARGGPERDRASSGAELSARRPLGHAPVR